MSEFTDDLRRQREAKLRQGEATQRERMDLVTMARQAVSNAPSSLFTLASDTVAPFLSPIETAKSMKELGIGIYELATPGEQPEEKLAKAVGNYYADRYGGIENVKRTFAADPAGFLADASMVITGGASALVRAPGTIGKVAQKAQKVGEKLNPLEYAVEYGAKVPEAAGKLTAEGLGLSTGAGSDAIIQAYRSGREGGEAQDALVANMRGEVDAGEVVDEALAGIKKMAADRSARYRTDKDALSLDQTKVQFPNVQQRIKALADTFEMEGQSSLSPAGQAKLRSVQKIISDWSKSEGLQTAAGLDFLKRKIDNLFPTGMNPGDEAAVITAARNIVKDEIVKQVPEYAAVMKPYEEAVKLEQEMVKALSLGKNNAAETALRKLQSVMRNNVQTNFGQRLRLVEQLEQAGDVLLLPKLAGQNLNALAPRGVVARGGALATSGGAVAGMSPTGAAMLPLMSPRVMGEAALKVGQTSRLLNDAQAALTSSFPRTVLDDVRAAGRRALDPMSLNRASEIGAVAGQVQDEEQRLLNAAQRALR